MEMQELLIALRDVLKKRGRVLVTVGRKGQWETRNGRAKGRPWGGVP